MLCTEKVHCIRGKPLRNILSPTLFFLGKKKKQISISNNLLFQRDRSQNPPVQLLTMCAVCIEQSLYLWCGAPVRACQHTSELPPQGFDFHYVDYRLLYTIGLWYRKIKQQRLQQVDPKRHQHRQKFSVHFQSEDSHLTDPTHFQGFAVHSLFPSVVQKSSTLYSLSTCFHL